MRYITSIKLKKRSGINKLSVDVYTTGRGGTYSPISYYLKYRGRWITPLEQRLYWENISIILLFKSIYTEKLSDLIYSKNPFLESIPKNDGFFGKYIPIPIKYGKI